MNLIARILHVALLMASFAAAPAIAADIYIADQNGDMKIGMKDGLVYLQYVSGSRQGDATLEQVIAVLQMNSEIDNERVLYDLDNDGYSPDDPDPAKQDCDDGNPYINPDANEIPGNEEDDDCDPSTPDKPNSPPEASDQSGSIDENLPVGTFVGKVEASDADGDDLTFNIKDKDVPFAIDNNGRITTTEEFDYEAEGQQTKWTLTIEISDGKDVKTITYTVDLNDIPQNVSNLSIDDINPPNGSAFFSKNDQIPILFEFDITGDSTPDLDEINASLSSSVADALDLPVITADDIKYSDGHATVNVVATPDNIPGPMPTSTSVSCTVNGQTVNSNEFLIAPL